MPNWTSPYRRACRDDRIEHLVHQIQSQDAKVMQIGSGPIILSGVNGVNRPIRRPQLRANSTKFEIRFGRSIMTIHHAIEVSWIYLVEILGRPV
jgi:hypothetical protein